MGVIVLLFAVPNAKYADMKYESWDKRKSIGIGGWSACSVLFSGDEDWAAAPYTDINGSTKEDYLASCFDALKGDCIDNGDFSTKLGANEQYQESWKECKQAKTEDWLSECEKITSCGSMHSKQCQNVSEAVTRDYAIDYSGIGAKWTAPAESALDDECQRRDGGHVCCVPLDELCTDVGGIAAAGGLATASTVFAFIGLIPLLAYAFMSESRDMKMALVGSAAVFGLTWILLLASWASVASALGSETTCYVQDDQNDGIVAATCKLGDIANGGSYGFGFVVGAWCLLTLALGVIVQRVVTDMKNGSSCPKKENDVPPGASDTA